MLGEQKVNGIILDAMKMDLTLQKWWAEEINHKVTMTMKETPEATAWLQATLLFGRNDAAVNDRSEQANQVVYTNNTVNISQCIIHYQH